MEAFRNIFNKVQCFSKHLIAVCMVVMMTVIFVQTMTRYVVFYSIPWSEELSRYLYVTLTLMGVNLAVTSKQLVRIDIIDNFVKGNTLNIIRCALAFVITVIFFTSKMAANSEIVAILSCGISFHRMMVPYIVSAAFIALFSLALNLFVIPQSNATRVEFESKYIKGHTKKTVRNIHYQIAPGEFVYVESFSTWNNTAYRFTLEEIRDNKLISKLSAETAVWDSTAACWKLKKYFIRDYTSALGDQVRSGAELDTVIDLSVKDLYIQKGEVETLSYKKLNEMIDIQKMRGDANVKVALIEKHTRFALPFSAFILTIMGVALSSKKRRGGIGWNIGIGIALSFSYILFLRFSQMFVYTDFLPPGIALWVPNILFAFVAGFLYKIAPK